MQKAGRVLLAAGAILWSASCPGGPPKLAAARPVPVGRAEKPVAIDGKLDEPCWKHASPVRVDYVHGKVGTLSPEKLAGVRYAWDEHYVYIGYETFDRNLVAVGSGEKQGPAGNRRDGCRIWQEGKKVDVVEFFFSLGDERFFWEIHHNAANQFNDVWCTVLPADRPVAHSTMSLYGLHLAQQEYLADEGPHKLATAVRLKRGPGGKPSTINDANDTDSGYTAEIRIPWAALGAPRKRQTWLDADTGKPATNQTKNRTRGWRMDGLAPRILAVVQDGDRKSRYHHSSPTLRGGWFHKGAADWPRYLLTTARARPKATDDEPGASGGISAQNYR